MNLNDCCECDCIKIDKVNQCEEVINFALGILNANKNLNFNITGRSKRIYRTTIETNDDGIASVDLEFLPVGYISVHYPGIYTVHFTDLENNAIEIGQSGKYCFNFSVLDIVEFDPETII